MDDLIVDWGEPRALRVAREKDLPIASAGNLQLLENANDGRVSIDGDELFAYSSTIRMPERGAQKQMAKLAGFPEGSYRVTVVIDASDAHFAGLFAWSDFEMAALAWVGFAAAAIMATYYHYRLYPRKKRPAFPMQEGGMPSESQTRFN